MRRLVPRSTTVVVLLAMSAPAFAQAPLDTAATLDSVAREVARLGRAHGESIWPGYRPDTIPLVFVLPTHGSFLFNWRGALPADYSPVPGLANVGWREQRLLGAASTSTIISGRGAAQVTVSGKGALDGAQLAGTAMHEAFHVFQRASAKPDRRFGAGENSVIVGTYPVFDLENESAFALEGRILAAAVSEPARPRKIELARQFLGVRRTRHARLTSEYSSFDQASEMNEGLANYALTRALRLAAASGPQAWRASAQRELIAMQGQLTDLTGTENLSLRFRYYQTGPALAQLLDDLAGPTWKSRLMAENWTLQDMLASATGLERPVEEALASAHRAFDYTRGRTETERRIERLKASRLAKVDTLLSMPGTRLVLLADSLPGKLFNSCGYDPQNLLQVTPRMQIQMRWWRPCSGGPTYAEFNVPSVIDEVAGTVSAVIGDDGEIKLQSAGQPITLADGDTLRDVRTFKLQAPRASVEAVRADMWRRGNVITIRPKRPN